MSDPARDYGPSYIEQEKREGEYHSRIVLNFFRHGDKPKAEPGQPDEEVRLTPAGREQARAVNADLYAKGASADTTLAMGGPRERSLETAAWAMTAHTDDLTGDETLEELRDKLDTEKHDRLKLKPDHEDYESSKIFGSKLGVDSRLNFEAGSAEYKAAEDKAYGPDHRGLRWLVDESDELAKKEGDPNLTSYSNSAAAVAEMIKKYEKIAPHFDNLVDTYKEQNRTEDTLQRFFGSHLSVPDAFLAKLIENNEGVEERDRFIAALDNHGLDFVEGFQAEIKTETPGGKPTVEIHYQKKDKDDKVIYEYNKVLDDKVLDQIIQQAEETFKG